MQLFLIIYFQKAVYVSGVSSAHHQEQHNCTYSFRYCQPMALQAGIVDEVELTAVRLVSWMRWNWLQASIVDEVELTEGWYRGWGGTDCNQAGIVDEMELTAGWYHGWGGTACRLVSWMRWNWLQSVPSHPRYKPAALLVDKIWSCMYGYVLLMMGGGTVRNM